MEILGVPLLRVLRAAGLFKAKRPSLSLVLKTNESPFIRDQLKQHCQQAGNFRVTVYRKHQRERCVGQIGYLPNFVVLI